MHINKGSSKEKNSRASMYQNKKPRIIIHIQFPSLIHSPNAHHSPPTTYNFANIFPPFSNCAFASATISSTISLAGFF